MLRSTFRMFVILLAAHGFNSCSVEKRHYLNGFYVEWKNGREKVNNRNDCDTKYAVDSTNGTAPINDNLICSVDSNVVVPLLIERSNIAVSGGIKNSVKIHPAKSDTLVNRSKTKLRQPDKDKERKWFFAGGLCGDITLLLLEVLLHSMVPPFVGLIAPLLLASLFLAGVVCTCIGAILGKEYISSLFFVYIIAILVVPIISIIKLIKWIIKLLKN